MSKSCCKLLNKDFAKLQLSYQVKLSLDFPRQSLGIFKNSKKSENKKLLKGFRVNCRQCYSRKAPSKRASFHRKHLYRFICVSYVERIFKFDQRQEKLHSRFSWQDHFEALRLSNKTENKVYYLQPEIGSLLKCQEGFLSSKVETALFSQRRLKPEL